MSLKAVFSSAGLVLAGFCASLPAQAQTVTIARECTALSPQSMKFDDRTHLLWYNRFWTGVCVSGLAWCQSGNPNWISAMAKLVAEVPAGERAAFQTRLCTVGHMIGHEWARDNGIRKIDTSAVSRFYAKLSAKTGTPQSRLDSVEAAAKKMLGRG